MATFTNETKSGEATTAQVLLIDDTYSLLIDDTYELQIQDVTSGVSWNNETKN